MFDEESLDIAVRPFKQIENEIDNSIIFHITDTYTNSPTDIANAQVFVDFTQQDNTVKVMLCIYFQNRSRATGEASLFVERKIKSVLARVNNTKNGEVIVSLFD